MYQRGRPSMRNKCISKCVKFKVDYWLAHDKQGHFSQFIVTRERGRDRIRDRIRVRFRAWLGVQKKRKVQLGASPYVGSRHYLCS